MAVKYSIAIDEEQIITVMEFFKEEWDFVPADVPISSRLIMPDNVIVSVPFAITAVDPLAPQKMLLSSVHVL